MCRKVTKGDICFIESVGYASFTFLIGNWVVFKGNEGDVGLGGSSLLENMAH